MDKTLRERVEDRLSALRLERSWMEERWREIRRFVLPYRGRFGHRGGDRQRLARRRDWNIINNTATRDARTLAAGLASGLTNPASSWFKLAPTDDAIAEVSGVRLWLNATESQIYRVFAKSNWYQQLNSLYLDLGCFGTSPIWHDEDREDISRFRVLQCGDYYLANDWRGLSTTCYREFQMTVGTVVEQFVAPGYGAEGAGSGDWSRVSSAVKNAWDKGDVDGEVTVGHAVEPMSARFRDQKGAGRWAYVSVYWELGSDKREQVLRVSGYEDCPVHAPRWDLALPDAYGTGPALEAIGDVRQLQIDERRLAQAIDRITGLGGFTGPPLSGGTSDLFGLDYVPIPVGSAAAQVRPLYEIAPAAIQMIREDIQRVEQRVSMSFYADLFRMLAELDQRSGVTATEINERKEEKLIALGPVVMRTTEELLDPAIDRVFNRLVRISRPLWARRQPAPLPPPPPELEDADLKIGYVSLLQQAQQSRRADGIQRLLQTAAGMAPYAPDAIDKIDTDEVLDELAQVWGINPHVLRADDAVKTIRDGRQAAAQAAKQDQQLQGMAGMANQLGGAKTDGTALGAMLKGAGVDPAGGQPPAANAA